MSNYEAIKCLEQVVDDLYALLSNAWDDYEEGELGVKSTLYEIDTVAQKARAALEKLTAGESEA